ncbi:hypothetical protein [Pseudoduganella violacea]|uniref:Uncharacterized protein n=1 Tax=Pseudoduganella violacea TaxID=1715466 RepID=A0A7W5FTE6_9BURK|nr:hypothetical protein [Pseudoduganella violacea]MBB3118103.1 hypothetical protein [Pseudoduganella violacea]
MITRSMIFVGVLVISPFAQATDLHEPERYLAKPLKGDYYVYGGSIGDKTPPTQKERKLSLMLIGPLAKDLFDHIGPDAKGACDVSPGYRERIRGDLSCIHTKDHGYACYFGLNVVTGKSTRDSIC